MSIMSCRWSLSEMGRRERYSSREDYETRVLCLRRQQYARNEVALCKLPGITLPRHSTPPQYPATVEYFAVNLSSEETVVKIV